MAQQSISGAVAPGIAGAGAPGGPISLGPTAAPVYAPTAAPPAFPQQTAAAPAQGQVPVAGTTNSKKIHTVPIHAGQDNPDAASAAAPAQTQAAPAPAAATTAAARNQAARAAAAKPVAAAPSGGQNGPLSIVPSQGGGDTTPHTRTALARPTTEPAPSSGGGVFVQLSSQRSEAEAQSAYRDMQARFPSQLGGHAPTVRQVTFPDKGTFYRTLIGPFASREQATQMCASLKAAGGTCLVQRN
jgi:cell division septation protein DedD